MILLHNGEPERSLLCNKVFRLWKNKCCIKITLRQKKMIMSQKSAIDQVCPRRVFCYINRKAEYVDIKLVALDLDGTLLNSEKELSTRNREALVNCIKSGIEVVPTTGRTVDGIPQFLKELPGIRYAITTNGAVIKNLITNEDIDVRKIPYERAMLILKLVKPLPLMYDPYINGRGISEERFYNHLEDYHLSEPMQKMVYATRDVVPDILKYVEDQKEPVEKINLFFPDLKERLKARELLQSIPDIVITSSIFNNLEINDKEATKGEGLLRLASYLNIGRDQTLACGDGENDYTMIQNAGFGVAMSNGDSYLKEVSDYITCSNDEDGVAEVLEKFTL